MTAARFRWNVAMSVQYWEKLAVLERNWSGLDQAHGSVPGKGMQDCRWLTVRQRSTNWIVSTMVRSLSMTEARRIVLTNSDMCWSTWLGSEEQAM